METLIREKFMRHPELAKQLRTTSPHTLVELNSWGDRFWGVCRGRGQNHLGRILMAVRDALRSTDECTHAIHAGK